MTLVVLTPSTTKESSTSSTAPVELKLLMSASTTQRHQSSRHGHSLNLCHRVLINVLLAHTALSISVNRTKYLLAVGLAEATAAVRRTNAALFGTRTLMYHDLGDGASSNGLYLLSSASFRAHIEATSQWAREKRIPFVPLEAEPQPGIAVTCDDGY